MSKLIVAAMCAMLAFPAMAEEQGSIADVTNAPPSEQNAAQTPADVDMANARAAAQAASGVPATPQAAPAEQGQPAGAAAGQPAAPAPAAEGQPAQQAGTAAEPKSSIPMGKRQGGDITECLQAGDKSDKAIAACAEKYRPRGRAR